MSYIYLWLWCYSLSFQGTWLGSARAVQVSYRRAVNHVKTSFSGSARAPSGSRAGAPLTTALLTYLESHLQIFLSEEATCSLSIHGKRPMILHYNNVLFSL